MSFALPSVKTRPDHAVEMGFEKGEFEVPDLMKTGLAVSAGSDLHPLITSEKNYRKSKHDLNMVILRNTQGLHAPLRIEMELKAAKKVGHLPFLPSSNIMLETLTGRDIEMMPEDYLNLPEFREAMGQPHAITEKSLGIL